MFGQSRQKAAPSLGEREASQPLLGADDDHSPNRNVVFAVDDDDDDDLDTEYGTPNDGEGRVRFREDVQVVAPSLRSTMSSREAGVYVSLSAVLSPRFSHSV